MTHSTAKDPDGIQNDEGTSVRPRVSVTQESTSTESRSGEINAVNPRNSDPVGAHRQRRIENKMQEARELLAQLRQTDRRWRLLNTAILRRDEVLLDGLIAELRTPSE